jgi:muramoyltetrapeptide carboxypeptidase LdcA involved in peptidoglycan recycling
MSQVALRLPDSLHERARQLAQQDKTSLNQFIALAVAEKVSALEVGRFFQSRAERGDLNKLEAILAKVPDVPPLAGDER